MTLSDSGQNREPERASGQAEMEALLPWYAVGKLRRRDRQRIEAALRSDRGLQRHVELVREELAETICVNESLGVPSARIMDRVMTAIDAEASAARKRMTARAVAGRFEALIASFSPRTLAAAASIAAVAIGLQGFMLIEKFSAGRQTAGLGSAGSGHFAMVRFVRQANAGEITDFLQSYQATVVDGPQPDGGYRVKIGLAAVAKEELARIIARMRHERVVEYAEASE